MIIRFRHKGLARFHLTGSVKGIQPAHAPKLSRILALLEVATSPLDLRVPSFEPHRLSGRYQAHWSLKVNANWRVIFCFVGHDVDDVNYLDYH